jgi:hypothetical protein
MAGVGFGRMTNRARYGQAYIQNNPHDLSAAAREATKQGSVT